MAVTTRLALPAMTILASALSFSIVAPDAASAETCLTAPKGTAPQGSWWKYRIEHPSKRKCWRLVQIDKPVAATPAPQPPQGDDDESDAAPAPAAPAPAATNQLAPKRVMTNTVAANTPAPNTFAANTFAANTPAPKTTERIVPETTAAAAPAPVTDNWLSRNASDTSEAAAPLPLQSAEAPAPRERIAQAAPAERAPVTAAEQSPAPPATITADSANAAQTESMGMLPLLLGAVALLGLVGGAFFLVMGWMRRRSDVLTNLRDAERNPAEPAELLPLADDAPTFAPLPPIGHEAPQDDVDEALRRFAGNARRRRVA